MLDIKVTPPFRQALLKLGLSPEQSKNAMVNWVKANITWHEQQMLSAYPQQRQPGGGKDWAAVTPEYASRKEDAGYNPDEIGIVTGAMRNSLFHEYNLSSLMGAVGYPEVGGSEYPKYFHALRPLLAQKSRAQQKAVTIFWQMVENERKGLAFSSGAALRGGV